MIYFDNAATTPVAECVKENYLTALRDYGNPSSTHAKGRTANEYLTDAKLKIAKYINAKPFEIYFTASGSESDNWAILGIVRQHGTKHIITTEIEHDAVLWACREAENEGCAVTYVKPNSNGIVEVRDIAKAITKDTGIVSVMWANNEIGTIQPIREIGEICKKHNILFHVDATQAMCTEEIDVKKCNIDLLTFSSHKIYAPVGLGVLYIRKGVRIRPLVFGGDQQNGRIAGTENYPLAYATGYAVHRCDCVRGRLRIFLSRIRDHFTSRVLSEISGTEVVGGYEERLVNIVNIHFEGCDAQSIILGLDLKGVCVSGGSACSSSSSIPSHVIKALGKSDKYAFSCVRFSFGAQNTLKEANKVVDYLKEIVKNIRAN